MLRRGSKLRRGPFTFHLLSKQGPARFGFVVGRKVGTAVSRNKVKRRLREATRRAASGAEGFDCVIRAQGEVSELSYEELERYVREALKGVMVDPR